MTSFPAVFHRDFKHDLPVPVPVEKPGLWEKCQKVALATVPLLSLHTPFRGPLSVGMSGIRAISFTTQILQHAKMGEYREALFSCLHVSLAVAAVGLFFFKPTFAFLTSSVSDLILNLRSFVEHMKAKEWHQALEAFSFATLDLLFISSLACGTIEMMVACMVVQIALDLYMMGKHMKKGDYLEGICQAIMTGAHFHQIIPEMKWLHLRSKLSKQLTFEVKPGVNRSYNRIDIDVPDEFYCSFYEFYKKGGKDAVLNDAHLAVEVKYGKYNKCKSVRLFFSDEVYRSMYELYKKDSLIRSGYLDHLHTVHFPKKQPVVPKIEDLVSRGVRANVWTYCAGRYGFEFNPGRGL